MKIVFIGCVEFSYLALERVLSLPDVSVAGVVTRRRGRFNADFRSLEGLVAEHDITTFLTDERSEKELAAFLTELQPDIIYCFGWSYLLAEKILKIPRLGVVGFHPAALPKNRGRHPIIWALVLGLEETASTFFLMDEGADSGPIISQTPIEVSRDDDARTLYDKISDAALAQITVFTGELVADNLHPVPQDHSEASNWRKRGDRDGEIHWPMSARMIHNLVRALTRPYVGAHFELDGRKCKVWRTEVGPDAEHNIEPGKVIELDRTTISVKCGEGTIRLLEHDIPTLPIRGDYLL